MLFRLLSLPAQSESRCLGELLHVLASEQVALEWHVWVDVYRGWKMTFLPFTAVEVGLIVIVAHEQGLFARFPSLHVI